MKQIVSFNDFERENLKLSSSDLVLINGGLIDEMSSLKTQARNTLNSSGAASDHFFRQMRDIGHVDNPDGWGPWMYAEGPYGG